MKERKKKGRQGRREKGRRREGKKGFRIREQVSLFMVIQNYIDLKILCPFPAGK